MQLDWAAAPLGATVVAAGAAFLRRWSWAVIPTTAASIVSAAWYATAPSTDVLLGGLTVVAGLAMVVLALTRVPTLAIADRVAVVLASLVAAISVVPVLTQPDWHNWWFYFPLVTAFAGATAIQPLSARAERIIPAIGTLAYAATQAPPLFYYASVTDQENPRNPVVLVLLAILVAAVFVARAGRPQSAVPAIPPQTLPMPPATMPTSGARKVLIGLGAVMAFVVVIAVAVNAVTRSASNQQADDSTVQLSECIVGNWHDDANGTFLYLGSNGTYSWTNSGISVSGQYRIDGDRMQMTTSSGQWSANTAQITCAGDRFTYTIDNTLYLIRIPTAN
jgi:hypothetical protein